MNMDQAAVFLAGSVLTVMGFIVIVIGIVAVNNILSKYWKPVRVFTPDSWTMFGSHHGGNTYRFAEPDELDKSGEPRVK